MPTLYRVIVLPEAFDELNEIIDHIEKDSPQNAAATLQRLWSACQTLETQPHRFKFYQQRRDPVRAVHAMSVPPFIVYYRINEPARAVRVLTVRHGARRQPRGFK